ncbi:DUF1684 domain-containing protein [Paenibacillus antarcticus]|nr:DUF1684 domain-containing protein [Paenibacillus antarcticus]
MTSIEDWRTDRQQSVAQTQGDLALIGLHTIADPMQIEGIPGWWAPNMENGSGLTLRAAASEQITVDGQVVDGIVTLDIDYSIVRFSETLTAVATAQPGSNHLLAVYDTNAVAMNTYEGISYFPFDSEWVIQAEFIKDDNHRTMAFTHNSDSDGNVRHHQSPGDITFIKEGVSYRLTPFTSGNVLIIVFGDVTNGKESYGMGRMLLVEPEDNGLVTLDFNKSFLPPCAFSYHFNCPLPPAHHRLPFEVTAGEMQVIFRS